MTEQTVSTEMTAYGNVSKLLGLDKQGGLDYLWYVFSQKPCWVEVKRSVWCSSLVQSTSIYIRTHDPIATRWDSLQTIAAKGGAKGKEFLVGLDPAAYIKGGA